MPVEWAESDPKYIQDSNEVRLRSFTTQIHKVDTMVRGVAMHVHLWGISINHRLLLIQVAFKSYKNEI